MDIFAWLSTSLNRYTKPKPDDGYKFIRPPVTNKDATHWRLYRPKPKPGFRFECLQDGRWLCLLCDRSVQDTQMGFHARTKHGWQAPAVKITAAHTR